MSEEVMDGIGLPRQKKTSTFFFVLFIAVVSPYLLLCTGPNPTRIAIYTTECTYIVPHQQKSPG